MAAVRRSEINRKTRETQIQLELTLDGSGQFKGGCGIGFFDHMLTLLSAHSGMDLQLQAVGDLQVDAHHSVEDIGICLGLALAEAVGDKRGIARYGMAFIPMDEALAQVCVDLSGRSYLVFDAEIKQQKVGDFDTELIEEFFRALAANSMMTLHIRLLYGHNTHHMIEAIFKAFGRALKEASHYTDSGQIPSTKGVL